VTENLKQRPRSPVILKKSLIEEGFSLHLLVPQDLLYFEGHFKHTPVVPGVCQIKWVVEALMEHTGRKVGIASMEAVKFFNLLFPGQEFNMEVRHRKEKWHYHLTSNGKNIARGRILETVPQGKNQQA